MIAQLADKAGLRQATISQIESGHGATRIETICTLLGALDLELTISPRSKSSSKDIEDIF
ncbi:helix-turn-helix domain-containing protein [Sphingomonas sp. DT-204]|uniref:helix-turn-helix domain-containing protein n=1 Tax=Sphingomonas sp. DT-204 TaxID=3396166 RepID=UPI003F1B81CE